MFKKTGFHPRLVAQLSFAQLLTSGLPLLLLLLFLLFWTRIFFCFFLAAGDTGPQGSSTSFFITLLF